jgi:cytochrome c oxidase subunit 1
MAVDAHSELRLRAREFESAVGQSAKAIGLLHLGSVALALLFGVALALGGRLAGDSVRGDRAFTLHGLVMVFLCLVPGIPLALGRLLLPATKESEARSWLGFASLAFYWIGALLLIVVATVSKLRTGIGFVAAYSARGSPIVECLTGALLLLGLSSALTAQELVGRGRRAAGPGRMPPLAWLLGLTGIVHWLALPVLAAGLALMLVERFAGVGVFDPALGGDPMLLRQLFWFCVQPLVLVSVLPAIGVLSELANVGGTRSGYAPVVYSALVIAILVFLTWGKHLVISGQSELVSALFSSMSLLLVLPCLYLVRVLAEAFAQTGIRSVSSLWGALALWLLGIAVLAGVPLGLPRLGQELYGTSFAAAELHAFGIGAGVLALVGGLHHFWPCIGARSYSGTLAGLGWVLTFVGVNLMLGSEFVAGLRGTLDGDRAPVLPLRVADVGALAFASGLLLVVGYLAWALRRSREATAPDSADDDLYALKELPPSQVSTR